MAFADLRDWINDLEERRDLQRIGAEVDWDEDDMIRHGIPTAVYGPGDWNTIPDESIPISDLVTAARVYAQVCAGIISQPR